MEKTHGNRIMTDPIGSPDYVWFDCRFYGLPDNTQGGIGYHVIYRPVAQFKNPAAYIDKAAGITKTMIDDVREHWSIVRERAKTEKVPGTKTCLEKNICYHCGTVCYGDCQS